MKFKTFLLALVLCIGIGTVGCTSKDNTTTLTTTLGEGEYQTMLNAKGNPIEGELLLLVESSKEALTEENIVKFYDEVIKNASSEDYRVGMIKCEDGYGLSFSPFNPYLTWGKIDNNIGNLLPNSRLEQIEKYVVVEGGKVTESNGD